jgi:hypothetical protein
MLDIGYWLIGVLGDSTDAHFIPLSVHHFIRSGKVSKHAVFLLVGWYGFSDSHYFCPAHQLD